MAGLYNQKGRGRKPKLTEEQEQEIKTWVKSDPKLLKRTRAKIYKKWGIEVSKETLKRIIKKRGMKWKRMKRGMSKSPDEWELEVKLPMILEFKKREKQEEIEIRYFDESGFSLKPSIPYGWQENKERIALRSSQSKRLNVLGLMNQKNELFYEIRTGKIDSDVVINFFDKFSQQISKPTVILMDQAPIHTSDRILEKLPEWERKKLQIFWLPTYSPKQNLIEILWKFIKYEWIEVEAYESWGNLFKYLKKVLDNFGKEYVINFG
jgi:transposase